MDPRGLAQLHMYEPCPICWTHSLLCSPLSPVTITVKNIQILKIGKTYRSINWIMSNVLLTN